MPVIIPDAYLTGGIRRGRVYVDAEELAAWLYKAASEPEQDEAVILFARNMAEMIEEGFPKR